MVSVAEVGVVSVVAAVVLCSARFKRKGLPATSYINTSMSAIKFKYKMTDVGAFTNEMILED